MDPQFKMLVIRVVAIGGIVLAIGTAGLIYAFQRLGRATPKNEPGSFVILIGAAALIIILCVVLLRMSPQVQ